jgi:hypothetical protein
MLQNIFTLNLSNIDRLLTEFLVILGFAVLTATHAMEGNEEKSSPADRTGALSYVHESEILNLTDKTHDLTVDNVNIEGEEDPYSPPEILCKILPYVEQFTLIRADAVCHFFKEEGDRIWEKRVLDLSYKLGLGLLRRTELNYESTMAALNGGRYKNVSLKGCSLGSRAHGFSKLMNCKVLDLSYNVCTNDYVSFRGVWTHLQELDLSHNIFMAEIFSQDFSAPALRRLNLSYNNLGPQTVNRFKEVFKHVEILILEPQKKDEEQVRIYQGFYLGAHIGYGVAHGRDWGRIPRSGHCDARGTRAY